MLKGRIGMRAVVVAGTALALAGCKVIPTAPRQPPPPPPADRLPPDEQRHRIALLVPLTGANAALGQSIANATTMALLDTEARTIRITTYDTTGGTAAAAQRAVADGNRLILGPVDADEVAAAASVARPARVPLITYSNDTGQAARDVFVMGMTPDNAISRVIGFARARGATRFGLLAPDGDYGSRAGAAFATAVRAAGGTVAGTASYDRANTSVLSAAQRLRARGPMDAVLVADGPRLALLAAPRLKARGADSPRLLGTDLWSGEASVGRSADLRGAWFAAPSDARFRQFATSYKARFGATPFRQATLGYDSVLLMVRIARDWRPGSPFPVGRLTDPAGFLGLDGPFRFSPTGQGERALEVREARSGGVTIVSPVPDHFGG